MQRALRVWQKTFGITDEAALKIANMLWGPHPPSASAEDPPATPSQPPASTEPSQQSSRSRLRAISRFSTPRSLDRFLEEIEARNKARRARRSHLLQRSPYRTAEEIEAQRRKTYRQAARAAEWMEAKPWRRGWKHDDVDGSPS